MQRQNTEHGSEPPFSQNPTTGGEATYPDTPGDLPAEDSQDYKPPPTFDDPELLKFYLNDGPYLDLHTDAVYRTLIRCTDPDTGWSFPSIPDLVYLSKMKPTAVRKYLKPLCEEPEKGGLGKFTKVTRENGTESNAYFLNAWANGLVPETMNAPSEDPLGEAKRLAADKVHAAKDWEIEARDLHIEQLKAQLEGLGITPVSPDEPLRAANPFATRTPPPPLPEEPPPPDYSDVDQWVDENWGRLKAGGLSNFIGYREHVRKNPSVIEDQEEKWRAADRAEGRLSRRSSRDEPESPSAPAWEGPPSDPEAHHIWLRVLGDLQMQLPRPTFETWLKPTQGMAIVEMDDTEVMVVSAPTPFAVEWLERRMFHALQRALEKVAERPMELHLRVAGSAAEVDTDGGGESDPGQERDGNDSPKV